MFVGKYASSGGTVAGLLMLLLTLVLYVPQLFFAGSVSEGITAINFVADTLLFAGTMLLITKAIWIRNHNRRQRPPNKSSFQSEPRVGATFEYDFIGSVALPHCHSGVQGGAPMRRRYSEGGSENRAASPGSGRPTCRAI